MTGGALVGLTLQSLRRGRRAFVLSAVAIAVGIAALSFFLALSAGVRTRVLGRAFPVDELEVGLPKAQVGGGGGLLGGLSELGLGGGGPRLDETTLATLRAIPGVRAAWGRMRLGFPARAFGGAALVGRDVQAELVAEGLDPAAVAGVDVGPLPFVDAPDAGEPAGPACTSDAECRAPAYCPADSGRCELPVPGVVSPFLVELYNGAIAPQHGLPKLGRFLLGRLRGFTFNVELGRSAFGLGAPKTATPPRVRRVMMVGVAPRAARLALTVPLATMQRWNRDYAGAGQSFSSVLLVLEPGADVARVAQRARALGLEPADEGAEKLGLLLSLVTLLLVVVAGATLLVAGVSIAQTFFRAVAERRRELGLLRALGASQREVRGLVLAEAAAVGLVGGSAGLALAWLAALACDLLARRVVPDFPFKPESFFAFGWSLCLGAVGCAVLSCLVGAWLPARAAARIDPSEALASS